MKVCDLHCDTLSELRYAQNRGESIPFHKNHLHIDLEKLQKGDYLLQCFAAFVNLKKEENPLAACLQMVDIYYSLLAQYPELLPVKTPEDVKKLKDIGADAVLIGEVLMRAGDKGAKLSELKGLTV